MEFIKKVVSGFAIGLGFSVALVIVSVVAMEYVISSMYEETIDATEEMMYKSYNAEDGMLKIVDEKSTKDSDGLIVTGAIRNTDEVSWSSINIEVELFDADGQFVHECSEYITQAIKPGESENFKLSCKGCKKKVLPEFETYKIEIVSAHSVFNS